MAPNYRHLVPGVNCAMYDSRENDRREFWEDGRLVVSVCREICVHDRTVLAMFVDAGRLPEAARQSWVDGQIAGSAEHIELPYRPAGRVGGGV